MPASLMGFGLFRALSRHLSFPFTPVENVLVQTVAGSMALSMNAAKTLLLTSVDELFFGSASRLWLRRRCRFGVSPCHQPQFPKRTS